MIWRGRSEPREERPEEQPQGSGSPAPEDRPPAPGSEVAQPPPATESPSSGRSSENVGTRIESILDAAERAAIGIREDAQEWARQYTEDSRRRADELASERIEEISTLTDNLLQRARSVAQQSDELIAALDEAGRRVSGQERPPGPPAPAPAPQQPPPAAEPPPPPKQPPAPPPVEPAPAPPPPQPAPPPEPAPPAPAEPPPAAAPAPPPPRATQGAEGGGVSEGARLLATQMAVAGSTRDEIAYRLREEFGIEDSSAILDEIGI